MGNISIAPSGGIIANILVVDDEEATRRILSMGIEQAGYQCITAGNALEAIDFLKKENISIVISDINMPHMNGIELLRQIKLDSHADVIIMTGYTSEYSYEDIIGMGASDFLQKPVQISEFIARLNRVIKERTTLSQRNEALKSLQDNLDKYKRAMDGIVQAISLAVELRDPYTAGHQQRVSNLACAIAEKMGLDQNQIDGLRMASNIHDLGKISVPAEILCKPGRLSKIEYELIKNHVEAGYDILKKIEFPWPLANIILQHHERLDGSGYPRGLKGEEILLEAKILSVADVFETIASHRPYRPSPGITKAKQEIFDQKDKLYDPQVVGICLEIVTRNNFTFDTPQQNDTFASFGYQSTS
ncbi:MAG: response regulator [Desulfobacteraceae bacterium]|nr:response regulator [Desulfobacteraceae bacterium]